MVILSNEAYESMEETAEERVDRLISEKFDKHYAGFEEFKADIIINVELAYYGKADKNLRSLRVDNFIIIYKFDFETHDIFILHIFHSKQNYFNLL